MSNHPFFPHSYPSIHPYIHFALDSSHLNTASYKISHFRLMFVCLWIRKRHGPWNGTSECFNAWGYEHIYCCEINDAYRVVFIALLRYVARIRNWFILFLPKKRNTREWCSVFLCYTLARWKKAFPHHKTPAIIRWRSYACIKLRT